MNYGCDPGYTCNIKYLVARLRVRVETSTGSHGTGYA